MTPAPIICLGQQPCGFFPRRFLVAKVKSARRLQAEIGGEIVFFYHDSDHDPRETQTTVRNRKTNQPATLNFTFANKVQRKYAPLFLKRVLPGWQEATARQLPAYVDEALVEMFKGVSATNVADFCLEMYHQMELLRDIRVVRSSDSTVRSEACDVSDFYVDTPYENEVVRARLRLEGLQLHQGGGSYVILPTCEIKKKQISPSRDTRLRWMQSVVRCTHYICGAGEQAYLNKDDAPGVTFINRDVIDRSDEAYTSLDL